MAKEKIEGDDRLSALSVYKIVAAEGRHELARDSVSIAWSALAAGIAISFSLIAEAALRAHLPDADWRHLVESFGYTAGFLLVILCRLQLFTENTITPVLPALESPTFACIGGTFRIWTISLVFNLLGGAAAAYLIVYGGIIPSEMTAAALDISRHVEKFTASETFMRAIPAGFIIAALVWMLPNSKGFEFWTVFLFVYLIALGDFAHVIVGSVELFTLVWNGEVSLMKVAAVNIAPALAGNLLGGTGLFALLAWAQVKEDMEDEEQEKSETG
ncbi:MAG: formate/nitrite transporter family protein [Pseudomonadota bacterium]